MTYEEFIKENDSYFKKLALSYSKRYRIPQHTIDDYYQIGIIGLWKDWDKYDETRSQNKITWAGFVFMSHVNVEIHKAMYNQKKVKSPRRVPQHLQVSLQEVLGEDEEYASLDLEEFLIDHRIMFEETMEWEDALIFALSREVNDTDLFVLRMRMEGHKIAEIADILGVTYNTVQLRWLFALRRIGDRINEAYAPLQEWKKISERKAYKG